MKICTKCKEPRRDEDFHKGVARCKFCRSAEEKARYARKADEIKAAVAAYRRNNPEKIKAGTKNWQKNNPRKCKISRAKWYKKNKEHHYEICRKWSVNHKTRIREYYKIHGEKKLSTAKGRLQNRMSGAIRLALRAKGGSKAGRSWESLVGYTVDQLKNHLEKQFTPAMNWANHGTYWHIDHKIPIAAFNFETPDDLDFKRCWALKNLQPLKKEINISKRDKVDRPFQPSLPIQVDWDDDGRARFG